MKEGGGRMGRPRDSLGRVDLRGWEGRRKRGVWIDDDVNFGTEVREGKGKRGTVGEEEIKIRLLEVKINREVWSLKKIRESRGKEQW
jgi:hypothetical protein